MSSISLRLGHVRHMHLVVCCWQCFCLMFANIILFSSCFFYIFDYFFLFLKHFLHLCTSLHCSTSLSFGHSCSHAKKESKTAHDRLWRRQEGQHLDCKCWRISLEIEDSVTFHTATGPQHDTMIGVTVGLEASAEDQEDYVKMGQELKNWLWLAVMKCSW